jgi:hypothetical protein
VNRIHRIWAARPLPLRVAAVTTVAGLVVFLVLARASAAVVARALTDTLDGKLVAAVSTAAPAVAAGRLVAQPLDAAVRIRVLDRAGTPVDGAEPTPLSAPDIRRLLAG